MSSPSVLLVTRDATLIDSVREAVASTDGFELDVVEDVDAACNRILDHDDVLVAIVHVGPEFPVAGVTRLLQIGSIVNPALVSLVISERHHAEQALSLLRLGITDCLARPIDVRRLAYLIDMTTLAARYGKRGEAASIPTPAPTSVLAATAAECPVETLGGGSTFLYAQASIVARLMDQVRRIAPQDTTILLGGETGTGKTHLAAEIHRLSNRRGQPFVAVNCGALSATLIESELFGHVKGSFTSAEAHREGKIAAAGKGTLFLDEIDSLPPALQAKLLRVVEERVFEPVGSNRSLKMQARLIVASNRPLEKEVEEGRFRADLFYRLNVVAFELPPLRERRPVIVAMARRFLEEYADRNGRPRLGFDPRVERALAAHDWPGNIRELRNVIERAVALCTGDAITLEDLPPAIARRADASAAEGPTSTLAAPIAVASASPVSASIATSSTGTLAASKEQAEFAQISEALRRNNNNRLRAAAELGISRMTLYNKMHKYGLMQATM